MLDPQVQRLLDEAAAEGVVPMRDQVVEQARREHEASTLQQGGTGPEMAREEDLALPGPGGELRVRLHVPAAPQAAGSLPVLVYFHGGGWVLGSPESFAPVCRRLAAASGAIVASVDYRRAPEHRFPAAVDDAEAATRWCAAHACEIGGDAERLAVGGDSAGGNLAAVVARRLRDAGGPSLRFQLLEYPVTDAAMDTESYARRATGFKLTRDDMAWYWEQYLGGTDGSDPDASPLRALELSGLPPALVLVPEHDPLRDEGEAYARRLRESGVDVELSVWPGMVHGFLRWPAVVDAAERAIGTCATALRAALAT